MGAAETDVTAGFVPCHLLELDLAPLITHTFPIAEIETALNLVGLKVQ